MKGRILRREYRTRPRASPQGLAFARPNAAMRACIEATYADIAIVQGRGERAPAR